VFEENQTVNLTLSNPTGGAVLGNPSAAVLTIIDNEQPPVQMPPYFPIDSGDFWTYQANGVSFTRTVLPGTVTINGLATKALADDNGFVQYFSNDSAGIRLHRQFVPNTDIGLGFPVNLEVTFNPPVVLANATMTVGQNVVSGGTAQTNNLPVVGVLTLGYSANFTAQGFETVTVPAGSFQALKLQGSLGIGGDVIFDTIYLVSNIGTIKLTETSQGIIETVELVETNLLLLKVHVDFDGDGKSDIAVYRDGTWFILRSLDGGVTGMGWGELPQDIPVPADYDGDSKTDIAVYRDGSWYIVRSSDGGVTYMGWGGLTQDKPVPADYDGDGKADVAVYRDGTWFIIRSSDGAWTSVGWGGLTQDKPVPADYDGDGKADVAVYRDGTWFIIRSSDGAWTSVGWGGLTQDKPVPADYDGDRKSDIAVYRGGGWYILRSSDGGVTYMEWGGLPQDIPLN
jgi:hypothetical protein